MAVKNITTNTTTQVSGPADEVYLTVNTGWTGTIVLVDNTTGSTPVVGTITNPTVSAPQVYKRAFATGVRVITTGTLGDITVSTKGAWGKMTTP